MKKDWIVMDVLKAIEDRRINAEGYRAIFGELLPYIMED